MGKPALNDLLVLSECLRRFPDETAKSFCEFVIRVKEGTGPARGRAKSASGAKAGEFTEKIRHFLQNRNAYDVGALRDLGGQIGKLTVPDIKAVGEAVGCPQSGKKKAEMVSRLTEWLVNIKLSAEQSSFTT